MSCGGSNRGYGPSNMVTFSILRGQSHTLHIDMGDDSLEDVTDVLFTAKTRPDAVADDASAVMTATGSIEVGDDGLYVEVILPSTETIKAMPGASLWWDLKFTYADGRGQSTMPAKLAVIAPITNR